MKAATNVYVFSYKNYTSESFQWSDSNEECDGMAKLSLMNNYQ